MSPVTCAVTQMPCVVLGSGGDVERCKVNFPLVSAPWRLRAWGPGCPGEGTAGTGSALLPCLCPSVLFCAASSSWLCWVFAFPCAVLGPGGAQGQRGARGVTSQPLPGVTAGAPLPTFRGAQLPSPCYSSYLFIQMSECDEVQKSKLAPERP